MRIAISTLSEIVAFADPASGRPASSGTDRARSAIVVVGQHDEGHAFVLDAWAARVATDTLTDQIFQTYEKWKQISRFGVEASAQQGLYVDGIIREAKTRRKRIPLMPIMQPTNQTKEFRITTIVQRWLHNGLLYINEALEDLIKELRNYPRGQTCDIVDALASCLYLLRDPFGGGGKVHYVTPDPKQAYVYQRV